MFDHEDLNNDANLYIYGSNMVEHLLRGGASLEMALKVLILLYKEYKKEETKEILQERVNQIHLNLLSHDGYKPRVRNIQQELEDLIAFRGSGHISLAEAYNDLKLTTKEERGACRVGFNRLFTRGIVDKEETGKTGKYRIIEKNEELIDIFSANTDEYNIRLPLGISDFVKIHAGNTIIVAGESNSGKTALALNIAAKNKEAHKINYLTSEMQDGTELKIRLNEFPYPLEYWRDVRFAFRTDSFPDLIRPDELNIIDYLDEGKDGEAYKMVGRIRDIANKVKGGLAVVCLQKHSSKSYGFGGEGTLNRARIYLSVARQGILKIEKGKIWRHQNINPNGMFIKFKLVAGCRFIKDSEWSRE
jgi:hypothetical protein